MELIFGAGEVDRRVDGVKGLLRAWREKEHDWGQRYLEYVSSTPRDRVVLEDLAVTMLINSNVSARAAISICEHGDSLDLGVLPAKALEETSADEREVAAGVIGAMAAWPYFGASLATKTLHKKRPSLIPVLDNLAIFGAYMNPDWPEKKALADTIKSPARIREALDWITVDLTRPENAAAWDELQAIDPERSRIELFDMVWWMYFRALEPVAPARP
jgi:hypothetical protein